MAGELPAEFASALNAANYLAALSTAAKNHHLPLVSISLPGAPDYTTLSVARSDHRSYWNKGIKAVMVTDTAELRNKAYHKADDVYDTLDFAFAELVTATIADAVRALAA